MSKSKSVPSLETERFILREHHINDFQDCAEMWADPRVAEYISGTPSTEEQTWSRFLRYKGHWCHLGFGYWVVQQKSDGKFVGEVGFADYRRNTVPSMEGIPEAGWVFKSDAHGKGFATEAVSRMLQWADSELRSKKTVCIFNPAHSASIHVAKKNGYGNEIIGSYGVHDTLFLERNRKQGSILDK